MNKEKINLIILGLTAIFFLMNLFMSSQILIVLIFTMLMAYITFNKINSKKLSIILMVSFILTTIFTIIIYNKNVFRFEDSIRHIVQVLILHNFKNSVNFSDMCQIAGSLHFGFLVYNYIILRLFGSLFALYMTNVFIVKVSIIIFYEHVKKRFNEKIAEYVFLACALSSYYLVFSTDVLKEPLVIFLTILIIQQYDKFLDNKYFFISILFLIVFLTMTRIYAGVSVAAGLFIDFIIVKFNEKNKITKDKEKNIIKPLIIGLILTIILILTEPIYGKYIIFGINFLKKADLTLQVVLKSLLSMFFSPLIINYNKMSYVYKPLLIDSTIFLILSPCFLAFIIALIKEKNIREKVMIYIVPIILYVLVMAIEYAASFPRQRSGVYSFLILIYAIGFDVLRNWWIKLRKEPKYNKNIL